MKENIMDDNIIEIKEIAGIWICCGLNIYAIGNSTQEAYNRYVHIAIDSEKDPLQIEACSFYFASRSVSFCTVDLNERIPR